MQFSLLGNGTVNVRLMTTGSYWLPRQCLRAGEWQSSLAEVLTALYTDAR